MQEKERIMERCVLCKTHGYDASEMAVGVCHYCKKALKDDYELLFRCAESVAQLYGYRMEDIYNNTRKAEMVAARRLISVAVLKLSDATSEDVARMMRLRGKDIASTSIRHTLLVARDLYSVSKNYRALLDKFLSDTIEQYMLSDSKGKVAVSSVVDGIANILIEEKLCTRAAAIDIAMRISSIINIQPYEKPSQATDDDDDSSPADEHSAE